MTRAADAAPVRFVQRVKWFDFFRMPPVSVNDEPSPLLPVLKQWI